MSNEFPAQELKRRLATYLPQKGENEAKFIIGLGNESVSIEADSINKKTTIFIASCRNTTITVFSTCTKIMMQGCSGVKLICNGVILTNCVEVWHCQDTHVHVNEILVATLQVDLCSNFFVSFSRKKLFHKMIWAAVQNYKISFEDDEELFENGFQNMVAKYPEETFQEKISQFIDSLENGTIRSEKLLRLQNGFPTTEREQKEFDQRSEKNQQLADEHYHGLVEKVSKDKDLQKLGIKTIKRNNDVSKVPKPNDNCLCESNRKYKKCCGQKRRNSEERGN